MGTKRPEQYGKGGGMPGLGKNKAGGTVSVAGHCASTKSESIAPGKGGGKKGR